MHRMNIRTSHVATLLLLLLTTLATKKIQAQFDIEDSNTTASLRGIHNVGGGVVWASGTGGTYLHTVDGGVTWQAARVPSAESLDFRGIRAVDARTVYLMSAGPGDKSRIYRIYRTVDAGVLAELQLTNPDPSGFWDAIAFWDAQHGIVLGDPVDGKFVILVTDDGGAHWRRKPTPPALPKEGAFAASGTCLIASGKQDLWFVTGGPAARVFHSTDRGQTWTVVSTPILSGGPSQGIFSIAVWDERHGVIVGGDYKNPKAADKNAAFTTDGGKTWILAEKPPSGYRSAVAVVFGTSPPALVAVGITGIDSSQDGGKTWSSMDAEEYNAVSFSQSIGWAVGPHGRIKRVVITLQK